MEGHHFIGQGHLEQRSFLASTPLSTVKIFCLANNKYSLSIRDGCVVLTSSNPNDPLQHWIKDMRYSTRIKDGDGFPAFALINKATGQAIKHSFGNTHKLRLILFNSHYLDESVLWTESMDMGNGFRHIRMINNSESVIDAANKSSNSNPHVIDGNKIILWKCWDGSNQRWKMVPYGDEFTLNPVYIPPGIYTPPGANPAYCGPFGGTVKIYCSANNECNLTIRNDTVVLGRANPRDPCQHWVKRTSYSTIIKDEEKMETFALVNRGTGQALKHSLSTCRPVRLVSFNPNYLDESVLWTHNKARNIRMVNNIKLMLHADIHDKEVQDGTNIILDRWTNGDNQRWMIVPWCNLGEDIQAGVNESLSLKGCLFDEFE